MEAGNNPALPERLLFASLAGAVPKGAVATAAASGIPQTGETALGTSTYGGLGYVCAALRAVDGARIEESIENQEWEEDGEAFKIVAPTKP